MAEFLAGNAFPQQAEERGLHGTPIARMPPQASQPLQKHVRGSQLGKQHVRIQVHALLHDLGGHEDGAFCPFSLRSQAGHPLTLQELAPVKRKTGVQQAHVRPPIAGGRPLPELHEIFLRTRHRIADPQDLGPLPGQLHGLRQSLSTSGMHHMHHLVRQ